MSTVFDNAAGSLRRWMKSFKCDYFGYKMNSWATTTSELNSVENSEFLKQRKAAAVTTFHWTSAAVSLSVMKHVSYFGPVRWLLSGFWMVTVTTCCFSYNSPSCSSPAVKGEPRRLDLDTESPHRKLSAGDKSLLTLCRWKLVLWLPGCICCWHSCNKRKNNGLIFPRRRRPADASYICSWWASASGDSVAHENLKFSSNTICHSWFTGQKLPGPMTFMGMIFFFFYCSALLRIGPLKSVVIVWKCLFHQSSYLNVVDRWRDGELGGQVDV